MKKIINKVLLLLLVAFVGISLVSCDDSKVDTSNKLVPYGSLTDKTYAEIGNIKLTEKALYDRIRTNGYDYLFDEMINIVVDETQSAVTVAGNEDEIDKIIDEKCYGTSDEKELGKMNSATKAKYVAQFKDQMSLLNVTITEDDIYTGAREHFLTTLKQTKFVEDLLTNENSKYYYGNEFQKENGKDVLDENGEKVENTYYITEDAMKSTYIAENDSNAKYNVVIVGFATYKEALDALNGYNLDEMTYENFVSIYNNEYKGYKTSDFLLTDEDLSVYDSNLVSMIKSMEKGKYVLLQQFGKMVYSVYLNEVKPETEIEELTEKQKQEAIDVIIENRLTSSLISSLLVEEVYSRDVTIYDPAFDALYAAENADHKRLQATDAWDNKLVAKIGDKTITVDKFYEKLEPVLGITSTMDFFTTQILLNSNETKVYRDKLTDKDIKAVDTELNSVLASFKKGELANSGYPTSIGEDNFKFLYYGTTDTNAIKDQIKSNTIWNYYVQDKPEAYYEIAAKFGQQYYEKYFDLSVKHILLTVDFDGDGNPDDPEIFANKESVDEADFHEAVRETMDAVVKEVHAIMAEDASLVDALTHVKKQFYAGAALTQENPAKANWALFREKYNFGLTVEDLSSVSSSNYTQYVKEFGIGVQELYSSLEDKDEDYLAEKVDSVNELIKTTYGYHILGVYDSGVASNARYTSSQYKEIKIKINGEEVVLDATNDKTNWATVNQIKIYEAQVNTDDGVTDLPTSVKSFISKFYSEFTAKYNNASFKNILFAKTHLNVTFVENKEVNTAKYANFLQIQMNKFDNYEDYSEKSISFLANWWTITLSNENTK